MFSVKTGTAAASCRPNSIREKGVLKSPQAFQNPKISNNSSAETAQSSAEGILNVRSPAIAAQRHIIAQAHHCRAAALPSASTAAAMAGAAAHSTEGAAAEGPAAKAAAHGRTGRTPVVVPGRAGPVIAGAGAIARAVSGTDRKSVV